MGLAEQVRATYDKFSAQVAAFDVASNDLAALSSSPLPADLAAERSRLSSWASVLSGTVRAAFDGLKAAYSWVIGSAPGLGLEPISTALALAAVVAASALLVKFLSDYASFKEKVALYKSGATSGDLAALDSSPLLSASPAFAWSLALGVALVLLVKMGRK